ncbi:ABC transporter ATP-binding protein [Vampirovibrio sp.]|uniref:ABC transporter ATP-binding protein n=1 Tax=Vampirovibrio sp. TaxID=2717857 RepID=UPI003593008C
MSASSQPVIEIQNLHKQYGEHQVNALKGINLSIQPGEFVALMGPSGCGKSTLLNILGTIDQPSQGQVLFHGAPIVGKSEKELTDFRRRELGFIFQFFNLLSTLTVQENVSLPLDLDDRLPEAERQKKVSAILDKVGMSHRADFFPSQLSGGEMQRVAIARALVHQPKVILADEPTGNLDTENGGAILELLKGLAGEGGPIILMATHSEEAAACAHRIVRMRDGQIRHE